MTFLRHFTPLILLLAAACGRGGAGGGGGPAANDAAVSQRVVEYFQKTVTTPGLTFKVTKVEDSEIPDWRKGNLEVSLGQQTQNVAFYVSRDGRYLFRGDAVDLTVDPLKLVRDKIKLDGEPSRGPADAKVTIVEYSDFQCPFCSRGYATIEKQVLTSYGDKVRFYYKHYPLPFHPWAEAGAVAAECAKQQKPEAFWKLYSSLFENQGQITADNLKEKATGYLAGTGIDMAKWNDCFDNKKSLPQVKAQMQEGSSVGVRGTPGFIINGRLVSGAQPFESFKNVIDDELASR